MADGTRATREDVVVVARLANLELPDDRRDQLVTTLSAFLEQLERLGQVDPGDREPPAITYESEARR